MIQIFGFLVIFSVGLWAGLYVFLNQIFPSIALTPDIENPEIVSQFIDSVSRMNFYFVPRSVRQKCVNKIKENLKSTCLYYENEKYDSLCLLAVTPSLLDFVITHDPTDKEIILKAIKLFLKISKETKARTDLKMDPPQVQQMTRKFIKTVDVVFTDLLRDDMFLNSFNQKHEHIPYICEYFRIYSKPKDHLVTLYIQKTAWDLKSFELVYLSMLRHDKLIVVLVENKFVKEVLEPGKIANMELIFFKLYNFYTKNHLLSTSDCMLVDAFILKCFVKMSHKGRVLTINIHS